MAPHSSVLAWRIPGMGEPGGLPSMGSHRVGHDWSDLAAAAAAFLCIHTHHIFFVHSSADGRFGCFHVLPTVNSVAMNIRVHVSFWISVLSDTRPGVELLDHMATVFFSFLRNLHMVFQQHATFLNWPVPLSIFPLRFNNNLFFFLLSYSPSSQCATACLDICH